ncbi:MAG: hypothetical protein ACYCTE_12170 [Acidimicrobiales bacterium]
MDKLRRLGAAGQRRVALATLAIKIKAGTEHDEEWPDDAGASLIEYVLLVALIALLVIGAILAFTHGLNSVFGHSTNCLNNPSSCQSSTAP